jgi:hypothetical protein
MSLRFHRSQACGRSPQTARIASSYLASALPPALVFRLLPYGLSVMSRSIGEPFPNNALDGDLGALNVIYTEPDAVAIAEIVFRKISVQMLFAAMLIDALHAALEDRVVPLDRVGVDVTAADVFAIGVVHGLMRATDICLDLEVLVPARRVSHDGAFLRHIGANDRQQVADRGPVNVEAARRSTALDKGKHDVSILGGIANTAALARWRTFLTAGKGFVDLDNLASTAHRIDADDPHGLTDTVRHEPSGFQGDAQSPVKLIAADPLLAGAQQVHGLQPKAHRNVAVLEYGADLHGEGLAALVALVNAYAGALALELANAVHAAAVRADRAFRPYAGFNPSVSCVFVLEGFGFEDRFGHGAVFPIVKQRYQAKLGTSSAISP